MSKYAAQTTVPVERSVAEIKRVLDRYGATQFGYAEDALRSLASVQFAAQGRHVRFVLQLPDRCNKQYCRNSRAPRKPAVALKAWEQACRQRWRALSLCIKAKLEAVEAGISAFEEEFLAHIILPGGQSVGQLMQPQIADAYQNGNLPPGITGLFPREAASSEAG